MPPSRRKGGKKSGGGGAAASRQFKLGDLVLAKVKGFPAWPATVSEPRKWGYSADRKKVFVCFFGAPQVAFCNHADVEAFTEEKKQSLAKRPGRGGEFACAVKEIIECYEKLRTENQDGDTSSGDEVAIANVSYSVDPSANTGLKDQMDAPFTINSQMKSSNYVIDRPEDAVALKDESYNIAASLEEATDNAIMTATVKSPFSITHTNAPVRRSRTRSTLQVQNFIVRCGDGGNNGGNSEDNISADAIQDTFIRRSKRIRKSPDLLRCDDTDSPAFAPNVSMEDNGSEIITINSDAFTLNEGSTIDSNFKFEQSEPIVCPEGEGLDLEIKAVINKKKRKPNQKKETNDSGAQNASQILQNMGGSSKERCLDQDGDEHLPLVKRARVRMGKSSTEAELNSISQVQVKSGKEDITDSPHQIITSSNCENGLAEGGSSVLNSALVNVSPSDLIAPCSENGSQICKIKKDQMFGCSVDDEAALPPSKRIHRALEAMSANAAEEGQTCMESSSSIMTSSGRCCISTIKRCPGMTVNQGGNELELKRLVSCGIDSSHVSVCSSSTRSNTINSTENESSTEVDKHLAKFQHESGKDVISGASQQGGEDISDSVVCHPAKIDSHGKISPNPDVKCCQVGNNKDSPGPSLLLNDDDNARPSNHSDASDTLEHVGISFDPVAGDTESDKLVPKNSINVPQNVVVACEDMMKQAVGDSSKINATYEVVKEVKFKGQEEDMNSISISNDYSGEKGNLGILSSPSLTEVRVFLPLGSPPNTSVCNISTSDSSNILQNGSCSPDVHQKNTLSGPTDGWKDGIVENELSRSEGKSTEAGDAALLYFEATLRTLKGTKESIGRATRIAIDCAKFGIAAKVMEILVHNLEIESSLHRRVDLFFLVDSIAQCSRGLKGGIGGVYPSTIKAVLARLLSAAAPPGNAAKENRRQCFKVLRLWLERKILPEPIIQHHMRELDSYSSSVSAGVHSRRSSRRERPFDDPVRDMEGMLDEYGSNSSFQLPGFCMPRMLEDDGGSDSDGGEFEAVTPEHDSETYEVQETTHAIEKHRHVLEDVDGELEMEDVAPSVDDELNLICNIDRGNAAEFEKNLPVSFGPPLPQDLPLSSPPPPSPPPPPPPPPPPSLPLSLLPPPPPTWHFKPATSDQYHVAVDSKGFEDSLTVKTNVLHPMAQPLAAPRNSQSIGDAVQYTVPECRDMPMQMSESTCSFNTFPVQPTDNSRNTDGATMHNKGYSIPPPHHVTSNQFSFVNGEHRMKSQREVLPPPSYSNGHHFMPSMTREYGYDNHERSRPPYDYQERWNVPPPCSGPPYHDRGVPAPYGCHPSESVSFPGHGWRFPAPSMNYRDSLPFRPHFEDAIPVANRGPSFWQPR